MKVALSYVWVYIHILFGLFNPVLCTSCSHYDRLSIQLKWQMCPQFQGYHVAYEKGFYKEECLQVNLQPAGGSINPLDEVMQGNADIGIEWFFAVCDARSQGKDVVIVSQVFARSGSYLASFRSEGIDHPLKLRGRKICLWPGDILTLEALLLKYGLHLEDVELYTKGTSVASLLDKTCDVLQVLSYDEYAMLLQSQTPQGTLYNEQDFHVIRLEEEGVASFEDNLFVRQSWLDSSPRQQEILIRFLRASLRGWIFAREHPEETARLFQPSAYFQWGVHNVNKLIWPSFANTTGFGNPSAERIQQSLVLYSLLNPGMQWNGSIFNLQYNELSKLNWSDNPDFVAHSWRPNDQIEFCQVGKDVQLCDRLVDGQMVQSNVDFLPALLASVFCVVSILISILLLEQTISAWETTPWYKQRIVRLEKLQPNVNSRENESEPLCIRLREWMCICPCRSNKKERYQKEQKKEVDHTYDTDKGRKTYIMFLRWFISTTLCFSLGVLYTPYMLFVSSVHWNYTQIKTAMSIPASITLACMTWLLVVLCFLISLTQMKTIRVAQIVASKVESRTIASVNTSFLDREDNISLKSTSGLKSNPTNVDHLVWQPSSPSKSYRSLSLPSVGTQKVPMHPSKPPFMHQYMHIIRYIPSFLFMLNLVGLQSATHWVLLAPVRWSSPWYVYGCTDVYAFLTYELGVRWLFFTKNDKKRYIVPLLWSCACILPFLIPWLAMTSSYVHAFSLIGQYTRSSKVVIVLTSLTTPILFIGLYMNSQSLKWSYASMETYVHRLLKSKHQVEQQYLSVRRQKDVLQQKSDRYERELFLQQYCLPYALGNERSYASLPFILSRIKLFLPPLSSTETWNWSQIRSSHVLYTMVKQYAHEKLCDELIWFMTDIEYFRQQWFFVYQSTKIANSSIYGISRIRDTNSNVPIAPLSPFQNSDCSRLSESSTICSSPRSPNSFLSPRRVGIDILPPTSTTVLDSSCVVVPSSLRMSQPSEVATLAIQIWKTYVHDQLINVGASKWTSCTNMMFQWLHETGCLPESVFLKGRHSNVQIEELVCGVKTCTILPPAQLFQDIEKEVHLLIRQNLLNGLSKEGSDHSRIWQSLYVPLS